ncbi:MAG: hypothetical protein IJX82_07740 [Clostridia bacterium]|nr:hypothetical protein [Clostridia bacterium]
MLHTFAENTIDKRTERIILVVFLSVYLLGMLLVSSYTSPLYPYDYGGDSAIFSLVGKGIANGKILYVDLFDHKGPILFFIEALGCLMGGRFGIWLLQCVFGAVNLLLLYYSWKLIRRKLGNSRLLDVIAIFIAGYSIFFYTFERGNLSEEFSLPFISGCLYLFVKYALRCSEKPRHPYLYSVVYGACLSVLMLIRINNAISVCAGIVAIAGYLITRREYRNLLLNFGFGLLGCSVVCLPVVVYFHLNGALDQMIYATFIYNFRYAGITGHQSILNHLWKYLVLYSPLLVSVLLYIIGVVKKRSCQKIAFIDVLIGCLLSSNLICLFVANIYPHYFAIFIPVYTLVLSYYWMLRVKTKELILIVICVLLNLYQVAYYFGAAVYTNYITRSTVQLSEGICSGVEQIPSEERDSVIGYNIPSKYYLLGNLLPCHKYYTFQEWWSTADPSIHQEFIAWLENESCLWLLVEPEEDNEEILQIIASKYELKFENEYLAFYRLRE